MSRSLFCTLLNVALFSTISLRAKIDVAPPPREIRPDGTRDPVPSPVIAMKENPLEVVQRIIKNSKRVGDKLAMTDTGNETRQTQEKILKDIQSLIDVQDNPPSPDQNPDMNPDSKQKNMDDKKDNKSDDMGKNMDMSKNMDMGKDGMPPPMGGNRDEPHARQPRQKNGGQPMPKGGQPKNPSGKQPQQPQTNATTSPPKNPKNTGGVVPDPKKGNPADPGRPLLPFEDEIVKEVWGHLPDKLRQQATQYYQQDFMPRYTELLKLYYSSLAEKSERK